MPIPMRFHTHVRTRAGSRYSNRRIVSRLSKRLGAKVNRSAVLLLGTWLWNLSIGSALASESAIFADQGARAASGSSATPNTASAPTATEVPETWNLHGQATLSNMVIRAFAPPIRVLTALPRPGTRRRQQLTLFADVRLWRGAALYINPEVDQGFGLSDTLGVAGFPSGEAYKVHFGRRRATAASEQRKHCRDVLFVAPRRGMSLSGRTTSTSSTLRTTATVVRFRSLPSAYAWSSDSVPRR
jgi:hypothetical protein